MLEWYDFVRLGTALICLTTMHILWHIFYKYPQHFTIRVLDYWWTLNIFLFAGFYSALDNVLHDREPSSSLIIIFLASLIALRATRVGNIEEMDRILSDKHPDLRTILRSLRTFLTRKY